MKNQVRKLTSKAREGVSSAFNSSFASGVAAVALVILIILAVSVVVAACVAVCVAIPGTILWALWNFAIAPTFSLPHISFWVAFAIAWALSIVGGFFRSR